MGNDDYSRCRCMIKKLLTTRVTQKELALFAQGDRSAALVCRGACPAVDAMLHLAHRFPLAAKGPALQHTVVDQLAALIMAFLDSSADYAPKNTNLPQLKDREKSTQQS